MKTTLETVDLTVGKRIGVVFKVKIILNSVVLNQVRVTDRTNLVVAISYDASFAADRDSKERAT